MFHRILDAIVAILLISVLIAEQFVELHSAGTILIVLHYSIHIGAVAMLLGEAISWHRHRTPNETVKEEKPKKCKHESYMAGHKNITENKGSATLSYGVEIWKCIHCGSEGYRRNTAIRMTKFEDDYYGDETYPRNTDLRLPKFEEGN